MLKGHISIFCVREVHLQHIESHWLRHFFGRVGGGGEAFGFPSCL